MNTITSGTIEDVEKLATELEADVAAQRVRLCRLCHAYARIIAVRSPELFEPRACHLGDEAGHYDNSFPPDIVYSERTGPRTLDPICADTTDDIPTTTGFYYEWRRVTTYGGLWIAIDGRWYRANEHGTGMRGSFAAGPGDCDVDCEIEWSTVDDDDLTLDELRTAEAHLRGIAFPASKAA